MPGERDYTRWPREELLALSDERDLWQRRLIEAEQRAYLAGRREGWRLGYRQGRLDEERDEARRWREAKRNLLACIPGTPEDKDSINRRLQAALSGERRDQADHEARFTAVAFATPPEQRTEVQQAWVDYVRRTEDRTPRPAGTPTPRAAADQSRPPPRPPGSRHSEPPRTSPRPDPAPAATPSAQRTVAQPWHPL